MTSNKRLTLIVITLVIITFPLFLLALQQTGVLNNRQISQMENSDLTHNTPITEPNLDEQSKNINQENQPGRFNSDTQPNQEDQPSSEQNYKEYQLEIIAENLYVPWSLVFTSPDRLIFTERDSGVKQIINGKLQDKALITFENLSTRSEEGVMGLTLHPSYNENQWVYVSYAYLNNGRPTLRVSRLTDTGNALTDEKIILDNIPTAQFHAGSRLHFGPDHKLYVTVGDATQRNEAQNLNSYLGKILRLNDDGSIPADNPFSDSAIYAYGLRNSQGFDWHPQSGKIWLTDHGPSGFDGPAGGDEINLVEPGGNYGWPLVSHEKTREETISPKQIFTPSIAPASAVFYQSNMFPELKDNLLFSGLVGEGIFRLKTEANNPDQVELQEKLDLPELGRIRDITVAQDGSIYFTTSNRDGRGTVRPNDDKIYRLYK